MAGREGGAVTDEERPKWLDEEIRAAVLAEREACAQRLRRAEDLADGALVHARLAQLRERAERAEAERDEAREMLRALGGATTE